MNLRMLGKTGLRVSPLGFGAAPIGYLDTDVGQVARVLEALLDEGVNLIDTAACYPGSEVALARAVGARRDEYVLVTKCGHSLEDLEGAEWSADLVSRTIDRSLSNLKTDHLDVVLLHSCGMDVLEQGEVYDALVRAREAGKARHIGYSGDGREAAYAADLDGVEVLETSLSICDQANLPEGIARASANNLGVIAKRPLANAPWKKLEEQPGMYQSYARVYTERFAAMGLTPEDLGFSGDPETIWPRIALRFAAHQIGVHVAIIGTTDPNHARANIAAVEEGPLPETAQTRIRDAFKEAERRSGEPWTAEI